MVGFCFRLFLVFLVYNLYTLGPGSVLLIHCPLYVSKKKKKNLHLCKSSLLLEKSVRYSGYVLINSIDYFLKMFYQSNLLFELILASTANIE